MSKKETELVNVIYEEENLIHEGTEIIQDCQKIQSETKCNLIISNDLTTLHFLLEYIKNIYPKTKFVLVVNGRSAENTINYIKECGFKSLFLNACIYTRNKNKYLNYQKENSEFITKISLDVRGVINFIKDGSKLIKDNPDNFSIQTLINFESYKEEYFQLHKQLSTYYGNISKDVFGVFFNDIQEFIKKDNLLKEKNEIINCFQAFSSLKDKNFTNLICTYLKYYSFSRYLNSLLMKKDLSIYKFISYFAGNLMYSIVKYGKEEFKGVDHGMTFYKGMQLNIIEVLEYLKNRDNLITFPSFLTITGKKMLAELNSKGNKKFMFSVLMKIEYLYDDGYEPCVYDLTALQQYPDEEEYILLPFTFLHLKKIYFDLDKHTANIDLEIIGKQEILEKKIIKGKNIEYDKEHHIMISK